MLDIFSGRRWFDFSSHPEGSRFYDTSVKSKIGYFKDETGGHPILEFVGLKPKMYSFQIYKGKTDGRPNLVEKHSAKGIQRATIAKLTHSEYLSQILDPQPQRVPHNRIGAQLHQLYTIDSDKSALCADDDKRLLLADGVNTLAYGHRDVPLQLEQ